MDISTLIEEASYLAHGYCLLWQPWLVALHAVPDFFIFLAYTTIPLTILRLLRLRPDLRKFSGLVGLFAAFILLCGFTHLIGILTLWFPIYPLHGLLKAVTAIVSIVTAVALVPLVPRVAALPSPAQLRSVNLQLRTEVASHEETLERLTQMQRTLEKRVEERTSELSESAGRLRLLAQETVHRNGNLLIQIQSIAHHIAREDRSDGDWFTAFDRRIAALSRGTQAVLKSRSGLTANVARIVAAEMALLNAEVRDRLHVAGPDTEVRPEAAQQIALLLSELATHSAWHGALANSDGRVDLVWENTGTSFQLTWQETEGGGWISQLQGTGIIARLLLQSVPVTLGGEAAVEAAPTDGYRLSVPIDALQPDDRTDPADRILDAYPRTPSRLAKPAEADLQSPSRQSSSPTSECSSAW